MTCMFQCHCISKTLYRGSLSQSCASLYSTGPLKVDFGCQTPTHFVERHIDHSYEWNEWSLRRRALLLANLRQKTTHSAQTAESHFKRDNQTQVCACVLKVEIQEVCNTLEPGDRAVLCN